MAGCSIDPEHPYKGMEHGSKADQVVWDGWRNRPDELGQVAERIIRIGSSETLDQPTGEEEEASAPEGVALYRMHRRLDRNQALVRAKKARVLKVTGRLACEVCDFESRRSTAMTWRASSTFITSRRYR
jgi:5-methylcytosine-specific restriction enzyme A